MAVDSPLAQASASRDRPSFAKPNQEQIVLLITIVLLVVFGLTLNGFATLTNLLNLLRSISILGILGLGMGMIVISRGIDLSEVAIMAGSWSIALIEMQRGMSVPAAFTAFPCRSWCLRPPPLRCNCFCRAPRSAGSSMRRATIPKPRGCPASRCVR